MALGFGAAADNNTVVLYFSQGFCGVFIKAGSGLSSFGSLMIILLNIVRESKGESSICQLRHEIAFSPSTSLVYRKMNIRRMLTVTT